MEIVNICISAAGVLASTAAIIFILKGYKKFVHRLTLLQSSLMELCQYYAVPAVYYSGAVVATREGLEDLCAAARFFSYVTC